MYAFVYDLAQPLNANHRKIFDIQRALPVGSKHLFEVNWTQKSRLLTTEFSFGSFKKIYGGFIENLFTTPAENQGQFGLKLAFCLCQKKEKIPSQRLHHIKVVSRWLFFAFSRAMNYSLLTFKDWFLRWCQPLFYLFYWTRKRTISSLWMEKPISLASSVSIDIGVHQQIYWFYIFAACF